MRSPTCSTYVPGLSAYFIAAAMLFAGCTSSLDSTRSSDAGAPPPPQDTGPVTVDSGPPEGYDAGVCADVELALEPTIPTVVVLVDRSSSMHEAFDGDVSRWASLQNALLDPNSVLSQLQDIVRFGITTYTYDQNHPVEVCPELETIEPALSNYAALDAFYSSIGPIGNTPTGESITQVMNQLLADPATGPKAILLATDGLPDTCANPDPIGDQQRLANEVSVLAAAASYANGIPVYVLAVDRDIAPEHLQALANAGVGAHGTDAPYWLGDKTEGLADAVRSIVQSQLSCEVTLRGAVEAGSECEGTVQLNGTSLPCNDANGWRLLDASTLELQGTACDALKSGAAVELEASFPCGVIAPF